MPHRAPMNAFRAMAESVTESNGVLIRVCGTVFFNASSRISESDKKDLFVGAPCKQTGYFKSKFDWVGFSRHGAWQSLEAPAETKWKPQTSMIINNERLIVELAKDDQIHEVSRFISLLLSEEGVPSSDADLHKDALQQINNHPLNGRIVAATLEGKLVGIATMHFTISTVTAKRVCYLEDVIVEPKFRSLGIGSKIIDFAFSQARRDDCYKCSLHVGIMNSRAATLYQRLGFDEQKATLMSKVLSGGPND